MRISIAAAAAAALLAPFASMAVASAMIPPPDGGGLSQLRQDTVNRAYAAINNPRKYELTRGGTVHSSTPGSDYNYLGSNGSNVQLNEYNDYNGEDWCGDFAAAIWTGHDKPDASNFPRLPAGYPSSQDWRTQTGSEYHAFSKSKLPTAGDVLVWQDGSGTAGVSNGEGYGHVGVVVSVNYSSKTVTTIEGNTPAAGNRDSITTHTYSWDSNGPSISDKHFMGYVDRD